jgi:hypothetical protein
LALLPHVGFSALLQLALPWLDTLACLSACLSAEVSSMSSGWEEAACPPASLAPLLAGLGKPGVGWADKLALFQSVQAAMQQSGSSHSVAADVASNADRLMAALLEAASDAHFKVATAALAALAAGLASPCSRLFEPQLDRVMTALFAR